MAINSLKDVELGKYVSINHDTDEITFKVMTAPASEGGEGCQHYDMVRTSLKMLKYFNSKYPCRENAITITKLEEALMWQEARTKDRVLREVEGKNQL